MMAKSNRMRTLSKEVDDRQMQETDLDQALDVVGFGVYNLKYCLVQSLFLVAVIVDPVGFSYLLPASRCDLEMSNSLKGFIASLPYIGIILTSFFWGYLVDTRGRKTTLIISTLGAGLFSAGSVFMPEIIGFTICKFIAALCIAGPVSAPYTYIGEIVPKRHRDVVLSVINAIQIMGAALIPLLAWAVLPSEFSVDFGAYQFTPWRLLNIVYALHLIIPVILLLPGPETPKFLVSQGRHDEAMAVLRTMYAANKRKTPEDFPIKAIKMPELNQNQKVGVLSSIERQIVPLLKPCYLKWMFLNAFLLFGAFCVLNGVGMWVPESLNKIFSETTSGGTTCDILKQGRNETQQDDAVCDAKINTTTYKVNALATTVWTILALIISAIVKVIGKKILLVLVFVMAGLFCIFVNITTDPMVSAVLMTATTLIACALGPINAYSVEIFPTNLRGMAIGLTMMFGRLGSFVGTNVAGTMIVAACEPLFFLFGGLMFLCGALSILLRSQKALHEPEATRL